MPRCKACKDQFTPARPMQSVCSPACAYERVRAQKEQAERQARSDRRKEDRDRREKLKTRSDYIKEAQIACNSYVRERDRGRLCISCGNTLRSGGTGGGFDAGHYRSVGSAPHLRFEPDNIHGQCKQCNRYGAGRAVDYRAGLVERIGLRRVEALEADQTPRKYSIPELIQIRDEFKAKAKELLSAL